LQSIFNDLKQHKERQLKDKEHLSKILDKKQFEPTKKKVKSDSESYSSVSNTPSPRNKSEY